MEMSRILKFLKSEMEVFDGWISDDDGITYVWLFNDLSLLYGLSFLFDIIKFKIYKR